MPRTTYKGLIANRPSGGGSKLQGTAPNGGYWKLKYNSRSKAGGDNRHVLFRINQLAGGVGKGFTQFSAGADGSGDYYLSSDSSAPAPGPSYNALTDASFQDAVDAWLVPATRPETEATYGPIADWNVTAVTDMNAAFQNATTFNEDISSWDVGLVTNMSEMFEDAGDFNQDIGGWNVGNVEDMSQMFRGANSFNKDISLWDTKNVTDMVAMFLQNTAFNQDISLWDVSKVTDMDHMFHDATFFNNGGGVQALDWANTSGVTDMQYMFDGATAFNQDLSSWNMSGVANTSQMFMGATAFNQDLSSWNMSGVIHMRNMFNGATDFNNGDTPGDSNNALNWITIGGVFGSGSLGLEDMFNGATAFNQDISSWDVGGVTDMEDMFEGATAFNQNLSSWSVGGVTNSTDMFAGTNLQITAGAGTAHDNRCLMQGAGTVWTTSGVLPAYITAQAPSPWDELC